MKSRNTDKHTGRNNATKASALYEIPSITIKTFDEESQPPDESPS
jgi:hypothetical protein